MSIRARSTNGLVATAVALLLAIGLLGLASSASAQDGESLTVQLEPENDSGVTGTLVLTADGDQTIVDLTLQGSEAGYEGHMFDSTCDDHRSATVFYGIDPVDENGVSRTVDDVSFDELTNGEYSVHIHRPAGEQGVGVACAKILKTAGVGGGTLPAAGVGPQGTSGTMTWLLFGLASVAALLVVAARSLRPEAARNR